MVLPFHDHMRHAGEPITMQGLATVLEGHEAGRIIGDVKRAYGITCMAIPKGEPRIDGACDAALGAPERIGPDGVIGAPVRPDTWPGRRADPSLTPAERPGIEALGRVER